MVLLSPSGLGSGVLVQADGLVLTNAHVVKGVDTVTVVRLDGTKAEGRVVERAADVDLALVDIDGAGLPTLALGGSAGLRVGSWVAAVGHGGGGAWTFATGMVTNIYPLGNDRPVFQTQVPVNPGNSGGPMLDRHGNVVGIVTAGVPGMDSVNFAIQSDVAVRRLKGLAGLCACLTVEVPAGVPVFVDGKNVGVGPRVVVPMTAGTHAVFAIVGGKKVERTVRWPEEKAVTLAP